jgi:hypothetical protein
MVIAHYDDITDEIMKARPWVGSDTIDDAIQKMTAAGKAEENLKKEEGVLKEKVKRYVGLAKDFAAAETNNNKRKSQCDADLKALESEVMVTAAAHITLHEQNLALVIRADQEDETILECLEVTEAAKKNRAKT